MSKNTRSGIGGWNRRSGVAVSVTTLTLALAAQAPAGPMIYDEVWSFSTNSAPTNASSPQNLVSARDGNLYGFVNTPCGISLFAFAPSRHLKVMPPVGMNVPVTPFMQAADGCLYGATYYGGASDCGTVLKVQTNGTGGVWCSMPSLIGDGVNGGIAQAADGNFYGALFDTPGDRFGGLGGCVFRLAPDGGVSTVLGFSDANPEMGDRPLTGPSTGMDGNVYGTTFAGGVWNDGEAYAVSPVSGFHRIYSFGHLVDDSFGDLPTTGIVQGADGSLYGTTSAHGPGGHGTLFRMTTGGAVIRLAILSDTTGYDCRDNLLVAKDGSIYGTTYSGGARGLGTLFRVTAQGAFEVLLSFDGTHGAPGPLVQGADGGIYGTSASGGALGGGFIFRVSDPPALQLTMSGGSVNISWPASAQNFVLQSSADMSDPNGWSDVSVPASFVGGGTSYSEPVGRGAKFYRLRKS